MATVTLYAFEDDDGAEQTFSTFNAVEAKDTARMNAWRCLANEYEWSDSEVVWDFTGKPGPRAVADPETLGTDDPALQAGDELRAGREKKLSKAARSGRKGRK